MHKSCMVVAVRRISIRKLRSFSIRGGDLLRPLPGSGAEAAIVGGVEDAAGNIDHVRRGTARRSERREIERVVTPDLPIGLGSEWSEINVALAPGDSLLMVSDGVLDQWGGSIEQLLAAITQLCADESVGTPQQLAAALCRGAADAGIPGDDATAVVFRREASSS